MNETWYAIEGYYEEMSKFSAQNQWDTVSYMWRGFWWESKRVYYCLSISLETLIMNKSMTEQASYFRLAWDLDRHSSAPDVAWSRRRTVRAPLPARRTSCHWDRSWSWSGRSQWCWTQGWSWAPAMSGAGTSYWRRGTQTSAVLGAWTEGEKRKV